MIALPPLLPCPSSHGFSPDGECARVGTPPVARCCSHVVPVALDALQEGIGRGAARAHRAHRCHVGDGSGIFGRGRFPRCALGVAARPAARDRTAVHRAGDPVLPWPPRHRRAGRRGRSGVRPHRRGRALRWVRCRPASALDPASGRPHLELRTGDHITCRGNRCPPRRHDRCPAVRPLRGTVPSLRGATVWRVCLAAQLPRRHPAFCSAADTPVPLAGRRVSARPC